SSSNISNKFLMPRTIQHDHGQVFNITAESTGNVLQVIFDWRVNINYTSRRRAHDNLVHVDVRRIQESTTLGRGEYRNRVVCPERAQVRALQRVNRDIHFRARTCARSRSEEHTSE